MHVYISTFYLILEGLGSGFSLNAVGNVIYTCIIRQGPFSSQWIVHHPRHLVHL